MKRQIKTLSTILIFLLLNNCENKTTETKRDNAPLSTIDESTENNDTTQETEPTETSPGTIQIETTGETIPDSLAQTDTTTTTTENRLITAYPGGLAISIFPQQTTSTNLWLSEPMVVGKTLKQKEI